MSGRSLLANKAHHLAILAERYRREGLEQQADFLEESAQALRDKYNLSEGGSIAQRLIDLLIQLEEIREVAPDKAEKVEEELEEEVTSFSRRLTAAFGESRANPPIPKEEEVTANAIGSRPIQCIREDEPVSNALATIIDRRISQLPIVDQEKNFVGLLTRKDFLRHKFSANGDLTTRTVKDILRPDSRETLGNVSPDASLHEVLQQFEEGKDVVIVVDDEAQEPLEIITPYDYLKFLRSHMT